jgi:phage shock protein E
MSKLVLILIVIIVLIGGVIFLMDQNNNSGTNTVGPVTVSSFSSLTPDKFNKALESRKYVLIDVRTTEEFKQGHLANAQQSDFYQTDAFSQYLDLLDKKSNYLIYCRTGKRSAAAMQIMQDKGFTSVNDLAGGYAAWTAAGFPTEN